MTSEPKWTKGPWHVETVKTSVGHAHKILPHNTCLYVDHRDSREVDAKTVTARANAYLQAAAPDMAEALEHYADQYCEGWCKEAPAHASFDDCGGCKARYALAKAKGQQG